MSLSLRVGKSSVHPGDTEIVSISAVDKNSSKPITASVSGNISSSGFLKKFRGSTDSSGKASYSWKVSSGDKTGKYRVIAQIYSPDYESKAASKTFKVPYLLLLAIQLIQTIIALRHLAMLLITVTTTIIILQMQVMLLILKIKIVTNILHP